MLRLCTTRPVWFKPGKPRKPRPVSLFTLEPWSLKDLQRPVTLFGQIILDVHCSGYIDTDFDEERRGSVLSSIAHDYAETHSPAPPARVYGYGKEKDRPAPEQASPLQARSTNAGMLTGQDDSPAGNPQIVYFARRTRPLLVPLRFETSHAQGASKVSCN
ncbi:uncharacterized protein EHS24_002409 [Apiotrichum porosum]|uniref:Uncharacterized protein n=1 Tax=Apiotrichum porosum TaxID=105984 RepID=A0A427XII4_9TREE|nr:uncharacterized protein EHS24_002409 [Apiotrichum porosum]RSH78680.1 hypothetical protein EHS24_002409 [Apiotrichum porosum]